MYSRLIDIHSHILPELDDGPSTIEEAIAMVRMAARAGTTDIVATPHCNVRFAFDPERIAVLLSKMRAAAGAEIRLYSGCDFHLTPENIESALAQPSRYTINQKSYLLVEWSEVTVPHTALEIFERLRGRGLIPVVTHPERNRVLQNRTDWLEEWVEHGCLLQVTAGAFLGHFGSHASKAVHALARRGLAHMAASDAHDTKYRAPALQEAYRHVASCYGESYARMLFVENPGAALNGRPLACARCIPPRRRKWLFLG